MNKGFPGGCSGVSRSVSRRGKLPAAWLVGLVAGTAALGAQADGQNGASWGIQVAQAQSARADAAEALFRQAQELGRTGDWEAACEKFAASSALEPGVGTLLYLGDCYERLDHFASASKVFTQAAELAGQRGDEERQHVAAVRAAALEPRAPKLEVRASGATLIPGLQITFNGIPLSSDELNSPQPRDAGAYEVEVSAPGYESFKSRIELRNGARTTAVLTVPELVKQTVVQLASPEVNAQKNAQRTSASSSAFFNQSTVGIIVGGVGLALAGTAGVLTTFAQGDSDDSKRLCNPDNPNVCSPRGVELREDAFDMATFATIAGVASGLALAGGTYLYFTAEGMESGTPEAATLHVAGSFDLF